MENTERLQLVVTGNLTGNLFVSDVRGLLKQTDYEYCIWTQMHFVTSSLKSFNGCILYSANWYLTLYEPHNY